MLNRWSDKWMDKNILSGTTGNLEDPVVSNSGKDGLDLLADKLVENLKNLFKNPIWDTKGFHIFKNLRPDGIQKIINVLNKEGLDSLEKIHGIFSIAEDKLKQVSFFRKSFTHDIYDQVYSIIAESDGKVTVSRFSRVLTDKSYINYLVLLRLYCIILSILSYTHSNWIFGKLPR